MSDYISNRDPGDESAGVDHGRARVPRLCVEGCGRPAGTPWSPYWCPQCDEERRARIDRRFEEIDERLRRQEHGQGGGR